MRLSMTVSAMTLMSFLSAVAIAGDIQVTATGFPVNHPGNGTFTLKQITNTNTGKPIDCWAQNGDNNGWVASYSASGEILTVTYCRNGFPNAVYRVTGTTLSAQNIGLSTSTVGREVPVSVSFSP